MSTKPVSGIFQPKTVKKQGKKTGISMVETRKKRSAANNVKKPDSQKIQCKKKCKLD